MTQVGFIQFDETGTYVQAYGHCLDTEETDTFKKVDNPHLFRNCYVLEGVLTERPLSSSPFEIEGGYRIQDCILDTAITLEDVVSGETLFHTRITEDTDDFIEFALEDVGQYQVTVASPLPHLETVMILSKD